VPVRTLQNRMRAADALLLATREDNSGLPGVLQNAIDWASRPPATSPLRFKPTAIMGASPGTFGTARAQLALRQSFVCTETYVLPAPQVLVFQAASRFDAHGQRTDEGTRKWSAVQRQDRVERPEFVGVTGRYVTGLVLSVGVMLGSALLPGAPRLLAWAALAGAWIGRVLLLSGPRAGQTPSLPPTESLVERFGLFTLIVLGEVVFGVVAGLSAAAHDVATIATGLVALVVGFGFWWLYFDVVGGRLPRSEGRVVANWMVSHGPITLAIAAAGAGMVGLIGHAHTAHTPVPTAWLLTGAVAVGLLAVIVAGHALVDVRRLAAAYRPLSAVLATGAVAGAVVGWARPAPWLLAVLLVAILTALWAGAGLARRGPCTARRACAPDRDTPGPPAATTGADLPGQGHWCGDGRPAPGQPPLST
jgi:Bacterial low temperature requirement A protein (LtrA)/NADPH-dependent FMN reductase